MWSLTERVDEGLMTRNGFLLLRRKGCRRGMYQKCRLCSSPRPPSMYDQTYRFYEPLPWPGPVQGTSLWLRNVRRKRCFYFQSVGGLFLCGAIVIDNVVCSTTCVLRGGAAFSLFLLRLVPRCRPRCSWFSGVFRRKTNAHFERSRKRQP